VQVYDHAIRSGHEVEVAALYDVGQVGEQLRAAGIVVHDLRMGSNRDLRVMPRLVRLLRSRKFDLVHVHLYRACLYGRIAAAIARVPVVVTTEHSLGTRLMEGRPITPSVRALYRATDRLSRRTIAVSSVVRDRLVAWGIAPAKIEVIPNGVDLERFAFRAERRAAARQAIGCGDDELVVGAVGRLVPSKGYDLITRGFSTLPDQARLVIVGDGPERAAIADLARSLGIDDRVHFLGERLDIDHLLAGFDMFVSASERGEETFGLATVEALASGLPIVVTYCPALDGVDDPRIVRCAPETAELARSLARARALVAAGTENRRAPAVLERFAIKAVVRQVDELYDTLCDGSVRRGRSDRGAGSTH
jgi:glycosyltransferase involved in cell wall biosynthesis